MAAPFAALSANLAATVDAHLANAEADFGGAVGLVPGRLEQAPVDVFAGYGGPAITFTAATAALVAVVRGDAVSIDGQGYVVVDSEQRGGRRVLRLEKS